jgi:hypothetical protein
MLACAAFRHASMQQLRTSPMLTCCLQMRDISCEAQLLAITSDEPLVQQQRQALSDMVAEALSGPAHMLQALQRQFDDLLQLDVDKYSSAWGRAQRSLEQDLQEISRWQQVGRSALIIIKDASQGGAAASVRELRN